MDLDLFDKVLSATPEFTEKRNYWFVRTQGGLYYDHFKKGGFIAIGFNGIGLFDIYESAKDKKKPLRLLTQTVKKRYPEETKPGYAASQLNKFAYQIKAGDIVIIPSVNSYRLTIGEVQETEVIITENTSQRPAYLESGEEACDFIKRKKVIWQKDVSKFKIDPILFKLLFSHHIITEANDYANSIDTLMSNFYVKGDEAVIILEVATEKDINARALFQMGDFLLELVDDFFVYHNLPNDTSKVDVKLNLQSPGKIQFSAKDKATVTIIGMLVIGLVGGGFKVKFQNFELDLSTNGLIQKVIDYQNNASNRAQDSRYLTVI
jgi:hypothetical protein